MATDAEASSLMSLGGSGGKKGEIYGIVYFSPIYIKIPLQEHVFDVDDG